MKVGECFVNDTGKEYFADDTEKEQFPLNGKEQFPLNEKEWLLHFPGKIPKSIHNVAQRIPLASQQQFHEPRGR